MKIGTHPKHIDVGTLSEKSSYDFAYKRFSQILTDKLGSSEIVRGKADLSEQLSPNAKYLKSSLTSSNSKDIAKSLRTRSKNSSALIDEYFEGGALEGLGDSFKLAEEKSAVNSVFLAALAALESDRGRSKIAVDKNNLFGFMAYDSDPYNSAMGFKDFKESIAHVADYLNREYLDKDGTYYKGLSVEDVNKNYATDKTWHKKISAIMADILKERGE